MNRQEVKARIEKLRREISHHRYLYHVLDRQEISDAAHDSLKRELTELEAQFPEFITADSPTQRVGGRPLKKFAKVRHRVRMTSLNDVFSPDELREWAARVRKLMSHFRLPIASGEFFAEAKGDGFAVSLVYERGILKTGATRGDGLFGENVTANLRTIDSIPLRIADDTALIEPHKEIHFIFKKFPRVREASAKLPAHLEVRGEVYMTKGAFARVNREQKRKGLATFANPRNIAAGSVRQLDPAITASRRLAFFAWDLVTDLGQKTHEEEHLIMKVLGFPTIPLAQCCRTLDDVIAFWKKVGTEREKLPFLIDGVVVQVNNTKLAERLGIVGKSPRGAVAFKFEGQEATTVVEDIVVQVGRTGVLTPVALLRPVRIGGVTVRRATLHNLDEIRRLDVRVGDTVLVERAGDVIPAVTGVLKRLRPEQAGEFHMPQKCPLCGSSVTHRAGEVAYRCSNKRCVAIQREGLSHFVSKRALDIPGLGAKNIDLLFDHGLIRDAADFFLLKKEDVADLERFGQKSADNLIRAIASRKKVRLSRFLYALGIHHVGEETALALANNFVSLEQIGRLSLDELRRVRDIGEVVGRSIVEWFRAERNQTLLKKLKDAGLEIAPTAVKRPAQTLVGKTFVLTGTLASLTRDEAKEKIRARGGAIAESVSGKIDYVVVGVGPGTKLAMAQRLGILQLNEKEFLKMI